MPLIQELPNTTTHAATPGWAYVPDTGYDPSKAPIVPTSRKRQSAARAQASIAQGESSDTVSARQHNKTARHLAELERENHKDVKIEVPGRARDVAQRGLRRDGRMSANVRRVLQSQKTWANHLADEEALVAQGVGAHAVIESGLRERESGTPAAVNVKRASVGGRRKSGTATKVEDVEAMDVDAEVPAEQAREQRPAESSGDEKIDHLVKIDLLQAPTAAEIEALLSQPPLSFNAARAAPTKSTAPARRFCEMCGYWGRAMCMKCGARVCGLDCKLAHEETSCQRFYG